MLQHLHPPLPAAAAAAALRRGTGAWLWQASPPPRQRRRRAWHAPPNCAAAPAQSLRACRCCCGAAAAAAGRRRPTRGATAAREPRPHPSSPARAAGTWRAASPPRSAWAHWAKRRPWRPPGPRSRHPQSRRHRRRQTRPPPQTRTARRAPHAAPRPTCRLWLRSRPRAAAPRRAQAQQRAPPGGAPASGCVCSERQMASMSIRSSRSMSLARVRASSAGGRWSASRPRRRTSASEARPPPPPPPPPLLARKAARRRASSRSSSPPPPPDEAARKLPPGDSSGSAVSGVLGGVGDVARLAQGDAGAAAAGTATAEEDGVRLWVPAWPPPARSAASDCRARMRASMTRWSSSSSRCSSSADCAREGASGVSARGHRGRRVARCY